MATFIERVRSGWNAFVSNKDPTQRGVDIGNSSWGRPDRMRFGYGHERSIVTAIYNRIAIDAASITIQHVRTDENGRFVEPINSGLNNALTLDANMDQTGRAFIQDAVMSLLDEGCVAIVPTDTDRNPENTSSFDILTLRTAKVLEWYPCHVKVRLYNERTAKKEDIILPKKDVAIVENPLYSIMNEQNSTLKRLIHKLNLMDVIDEQSSSGKLDMIISLPYAIKTPARREQAEQRRKDIEMQLSGSKYGIAYTDGTERITQLNRSLENNLMSQVEYLTKMLYGQLGITEEVMNGTANESVMLNYHNRTIEPILSAITDEMKRKFLSKTARTQKQSIMFFRDPFKLAPVNTIADIADKFTRNEILSTNEVRGLIGMKPSNDPKADELRNKNINQSGEEMQPAEAPDSNGEKIENEERGAIDELLDSI